MSELAHAVLIVDVFNIFIRHYKANPRVNPDGVHVGGTYGTTSAVSRVVQRYDIKQVVPVWEVGGSKYKRKLYKEYKHGRFPSKKGFRPLDSGEPIENETGRQMAQLAQIWELCGIPQVSVEDTEFDDVAAYLAKHVFHNHKVYIYTADADMWQVLDPEGRIEMIIPQSGKEERVFGFAEMREEIKVHPENWALAKAIIGDESDNIPGVQSVGLSGLVSIVPQFSEPHFIDFERLEDLLKEAAKHKKSKKIDNMLGSMDLIKRNYQLTYLSTHRGVKTHHLAEIEQQLQEQPEASYVKWVQHHAADGQFVPRSEWDLFASHRNKSKKKED